MKTKRILIWICVLIFVIPCLLWVGALVEDCLVTAICKDEFSSIKLAENEEPLPEFDWYRITSYSEEKIEIYYVNNMAGEYKIGGTKEVVESYFADWKSSGEKITWTSIKQK